MSPSVHWPRFLNSRKLAVIPKPRGGLSRAQVLNHLIGLTSEKRYLEIGVNTPAQPGYSRSSINANLVRGVDPNPSTAAEFIMTSDEFFASNEELCFDVVFIDGLHLFEQAFKDILNAISVTDQAGFVVVHDTRPSNYATTTRRHQGTNEWHGDVWKSIVLLRLSFPELKVVTVDTDEGLTVISKRGGEPLEDPLNEGLFTWNYFAENYRSLLNLVDIEEFLAIYG